MNSDNSAERGASRNAVTFGLALVGIVIGVVAGRSITDTRRSLVEVGDPTFGLAEDFSHLPISATDGFESTLGDFAAGRPVVMTIRDAYCPVSRRYGPKTGLASATTTESGASGSST